MDAAGFIVLVEEELERKAALYKNVLVQAVLFRNGDTWRHALTKITPQPARIRIRPRKALVYEQAVLVDVVWSLSETREKLNQQAITGAIDIGTYCVVQPNPSYSEDPGRRVPSRSDYSDWPCTPIKIEPGDRLPLPDRPLVSTARTFASLHDAIREWIKLRQYHDDRDARRGALLVVFSDYRLRITDVIPGPRGVTVSVQQAPNLGQLNCHVVGQARSGRIEGSARFVKKSAFLAGMSEILDLQIFVTSKDEQLDSYREIDYQHGVSGRSSAPGDPARAVAASEETSAGESVTNSDQVAITSRHAGRWDVFICHASEDKADVALPLAGALRAAGLRVWIDQAELQLGDSLSRRIDDGLIHSKYGVVILSPAFFGRQWPERELSGLVQREVDGKVILPVWYNVEHADVLKYSPTLADRVAAKWREGLGSVVAAVLNVCQAGRASDPLVQSDSRAERNPPPMSTTSRFQQLKDERRFSVLTEAFDRLTMLLGMLTAATTEESLKKVRTDHNWIIQNRPFMPPGLAEKWLGVELGLSRALNMQRRRDFDPDALTELDMQVDQLCREAVAILEAEMGGAPLRLEMPWRTPNPLE